MSEQDDGRKFVHLMTTAMLGKTAKHLENEHGDQVHGEGTEARANAAAHLEAHGIPLDARWSPRQHQFVRPKAASR
jgi:hypothetical protein